MKTLIVVVFSAFFAVALTAADHPNILWISSEDNGPQLGCYGDEYAVTPNLDALAARGLRYTRASSNAPVCAPARTTIISGVFPPSTGAEHMRSQVELPDEIRLFPAFLRELGYYTTNRSKEDYNLAGQDGVWDESSNKATWKNREGDQPFFAVFNSTISHESKIRNEMDDSLRIHDPALAPVPAYHPDTPEVRKDWAQYYDRITQMDAELGKELDAIEKAGLSDDTIIFYWGDHGSGMPRSKRWPYNSGLHVPLLVHFPEKWQHLAPEGYVEGGSDDRRVGFIDLAPTMLSLVGIEPKDYMQGTAFAGKFAGEGRQFSYGFRGRMDERIDLVRTVFGKRYVYLRQYMPHRIYGQFIEYMFETPTTQVWSRMHAAGELNEAQSHFWERKPSEELYDLETDPDEVNNLVGSADHAPILAKMRKAHADWEREIRDIGFLPEGEIHRRAVGSTPYEVGQDAEKYDFDSVFAAAQTATSQKVEDIPAIVEMLESEDSGVRYWGATGLLIQGDEGVAEGGEALKSALGDESPSVAIAAAEALATYGPDESREAAVDVLLKFANQAEGSVFDAMLAVNAIDYVDGVLEARAKEILSLPTEPGKQAPRVDKYVGSLLNKLRSDLEVK